MGNDSICDEEGFSGNCAIEEEGIHEEDKEEVHEENDVDFIKGIFDDDVSVKEDVALQKLHDYSNIDVAPTYDIDGAPIDSDPFGLEPLINKKRDKDCEMKGSVTPNFPPGFSPISASSHNQQDGFLEYHVTQSMNCFF